MDITNFDSLKSTMYFRQVDPPATPIVNSRGKKLIMLGSNNYLGLANHPKVIEAAINAIKDYGTGCCSSRVLSGTTSLHNKLERKIAEFKKTEDAIVFSTGFMSMMGTITALTKESDVILSDELNHASIVDGCRLSRAEVKIYRHGDMQSLEEEISKCSSFNKKLIITDGVFSMKGTVAKLPEIKQIADKYKALIMVDDAHGTGVMGKDGRGTPEYYNMEGQIDIVCGTFSKALGTIGGFAASTKNVVDYLRINSRPFIFKASPPPSVAATAIACLEIIENEPQIRQKLRENTDFMKKGLREAGFILEDNPTPIIPIIIGNDEKTLKMALELDDRGVFINPVIPPAVPKEKSLIRISMMASLSFDELTKALDAFKSSGKKLGLI